MRKGRRVLVAEEGVVGVTDILWMICWGEFMGGMCILRALHLVGTGEYWDMNWAVLFCRGCGGSYIHLNTCLGGGGIIYKSSIQVSLNNLTCSIIVV